MSRLPPPLAPWAAHLGLLQRELALALAPWVQRLSVGLGPVSASLQRPQGAPDGVDGVTSRGPYDRLLTTEWLLAEELPDEFVRRAAQGEHLFTRLATRDPQRARRCFVLLDSGPSQLGTPRLAHLAALITFASRCEAVGAKLSWGVAQQVPTTFHEGLTRSDLEALLKSRASREPNSQELQQWLESVGLGADEVWLVGGRPFLDLPLAARTQRVEVRDVLEPGVRAIEVVLERRAQTPRPLRLELPPPQVCTSLLRNPFPTPRPPPRRSSGRLTHGLVFSSSGNRLCALGPDGEFLSHPLPDRGGATVRIVSFQPPPNERVIAGGWHRGLSCISARLDDAGNATQFTAWALTKRAERKPADPEVFEVAGAPIPIPEHAFADVATLTRHHTRRRMLTFLGRCFTLEGGRVIERRDQVLAHAQRNERLLLVTCDDEGRRTARTCFPDHEESKQALEGLGPCSVFFAAGARYPYPMLAMSSDAASGQWTLVDVSRSSFGIEVPDGLVVGVTNPGPWAPGVLTKSRDGRQLSHVSAQGVQRIVECEAGITELAFDHERPRIAWVDAEGSVGVFDFTVPQSVFVGLPDARGQSLLHFTEYRR